MARRYAYICDAKGRFLEKIWPGSVTVIFHHKENLPKALTDGSDTIGVCMSDDPLVVQLLQHTDVPVAQTSANSSHTVIDYTDAKPMILRTGAISKEELDELLMIVIE
ncbi:MAG: Sua5/YciO/YrdC/YwlC family protein [Candidatus Sungbacteria bacterium]|nr:Sua5/YciO/YrdC/YwlC family protein [Candidatus Sungbacteria bacterium]